MTTQLKVTEHAFDTSHIESIRDLAIDDSGNLYICDEFNHCILKYNSDLQHLATFGKQGKAPGEFHYPSGIVIHKDRLFVADAWNHRIQILNLDGIPQQSLGQMGEGLDDFLVPLDVKLGPENRLWILDSDNHAVKIFDPQTLERLKVYVGGKDNSIELMWNTKEPIQYGLPIYYPKQIHFSGQTAYIQDMDKLTRFGPELIDDFRFPIPRYRCPMIASSHSGVVLFDQHKQNLSHCNFFNLQETEIATLSGNQRAIFEIQGTWWIFSESKLIQCASLSPEVPWETNSLPSQFQKQATTTEEEIQTLSLKDGLAQFESFLQVFKDQEDAFQNQSTDAISNNNPESRINPDYLHENLKDHNQQMETFFRIFINQQARAVSEWSRKLANATREHCQALLSDQATSLFKTLRSAYEYKLHFLLQLQETIQAPSINRQVVNKIDGCMFLINRFLCLVLKIARLYRERFESLNLTNELESPELPIFFLKEVPANTQAALTHLLNCLHHDSPSTFSLANNAGEALIKSWASMEKAAIAQAHQALVLNPEERQTFQNEQLAHTLWAEHTQIFSYDGKLHKAFGFPFSIQNLLLFAGWCGFEPQGQVLFGTIYNTDLKKLPNVRYDTAIYKATLPNPQQAIDILENNVRDLETYGLALKTQNQYSPDYLNSVIYLSYNHARANNFSAAHTCLEKIKGDQEYNHILARVYVLQENYQEAITAFDAVPTWSAQLNLGMLFLDLGFFDKALALFQSPREGFPPKMAKLFIAITHRQAGEQATAQKQLEHLFEEGVQTTAYHMGILYRQMGENDKALQQFDIQQKLCPMVVNQIEKAITLRKMGNNAASQEILRTLPEETYLEWGPQRVKVKDAEFLNLIDQMLSTEAIPRQAHEENDPHIWLNRIQTFTAMYFAFQDQSLNNMHSKYRSL